jgi:hypothetical protein
LPGIELPSSIVARLARLRALRAASLALADQLKSKGLSLYIEATNITQGFQAAQNTVAEPDEQISFTLHINNPTSKPIIADIREDLSDILEYSELIDEGGATLSDKNVIAWPQTSIIPGAQQTRTFRVRILSEIPATPTGINNSMSYDCKISSAFGNTINIKLNCPTPKIIENIISKLPNIAQSSSIIISSVIFFIILFFYIRNKQMQKEIQIIRKDINSGII